VFSSIIKNVVSSWVSSGIILDTDSDIYEYGFELILFSIINVTIIILTSLFVNKVPESIALLLAVIPLQSCGGGYHAKTHMRCFLIMYIGWWICIWLLPYISLLFMVLIIALSLIMIFTLAPVSHENVTLSDKQRLKMKHYVRIISIIIAIISVVTYILGMLNRNVSIAFALGMGGVAISMMVSQLKRLM